MIQFYIYYPLYLFFIRFFSIIGYYRIQSIVSCATQYVLFPFGNRKFQTQSELQLRVISNSLEYEARFSFLMHALSIFAKIMSDKAKGLSSTNHA